MARITVEDCVEVIPNRFELCLIAGNRAKSILSGAPTNIDRKEKPAVIALREIAEGLLDIVHIDLVEILFLLFSLHIHPSILQRLIFGREWVEKLLKKVGLF